MCGVQGKLWDWDSAEADVMLLGGEAVPALLISSNGGGPTAGLVSHSLDGCLVYHCVVL